MDCDGLSTFIQSVAQLLVKVNYRPLYLEYL